MPRIKPYVTSRTGIVCARRGSVECVFLCYFFILFQYLCLYACLLLTYVYLILILLLNLFSWSLSCCVPLILGVMTFLWLCYVKTFCLWNLSWLPIHISLILVYSCPHKRLLREYAGLSPELQRVFLGKFKCICLMLECIPKSRYLEFVQGLISVQDLVLILGVIACICFY